MDTLSIRLKFALKKAEMSQADLASKIGVRPQVINYLYQCNPKSSKYTYLIADALKVDPTWLATGSGNYNVESESSLSITQKIPILTYQQLKYVVTNLESFNDLEVKHWLSTHLQLGDKSFAVKLKDKSMFPRFDEGAILIFDSNFSIADGIISTIYNKITDDIMIRQVVYKTGKMTLTAINHTNYSTLELTDNIIVFGCLKEVRLYENQHF